MNERRMATPRRRHYRDSAERDHLILLGITFTLGAMLGAAITLGVLTL